jgi:hypothetical protein
MTDADRSRIVGVFVALFIGAVIVVAVGIYIVIIFWMASPAHARDDGRYAGSPLKGWFDSLKSGKGPCCSDADGTALSDVDWESKDGHYRVRIEGQWIDVPENAVLTQPNLIGRTMVWPIYYRSELNPVRVEIRCFIPGSMG